MPIVESVGQVQPWGTLSGLTLGYEISPRWEMTLSWGALTSDVDDELVTGAKEPRTLRQVRLRSVLLGTRWFPLRYTRWRPFAAFAVGSFEGVEQGNLFDGTDKWSKSQFLWQSVRRWPRRRPHGSDLRRNPPDIQLDDPLHRVGGWPSRVSRRRISRRRQLAFWRSAMRCQLPIRFFR